MKDFEKFIYNGLEKWKKIKQDFSQNKGLSDFLNKSYLVVCFDHHQLDMELAKNLYKPIYGKGKTPAPEELKREEFRQEMARYYEKNIKEMSLQVRFPSVNIEFIQELKTHPLIKGLNSPSRASIKVIIDHKNFMR